jgi:hypothetical protein
MSEGPTGLELNAASIVVGFDRKQLLEGPMTSYSMNYYSMK